MIPSVVKPKFTWSADTLVGPRSEITTRDGVISGIVPWVYMRSNGVKNIQAFSNDLDGLFATHCYEKGIGIQAR